MKSNLTYYISLFVSLLLLSILVFTPPATAQSKWVRKRKQLEQQKKAIQKELQLNQEILNSTKNKKRATINDIQLLEKQIEQRQEMIYNITQQIAILDTSLQITKFQIDSLAQQLTVLKEDYAKTARQVYLTSSTYDRVLFLLASSSFNEAFRRLKYMQYYSDHRKKQLQNIQELGINLQAKKDTLAQKKQAKKELLTAEQQQKAELELTQVKKEKMVAQLQAKEEKVTQQISENRQSVSQLNGKIENAIAKAIAEAEAIARAKAEAERRAREKAAAEKRAREKAESEKRARAKAEAEKRAREKAEAEKQAAKAKTVNKPKPESKPKPKWKPKPAPTVTKKTAKSTTTDKPKPAAKPVPKTKKVNLTNIGARFAKNKRKMSWPVKGVVTGRYGKHQHPVLKNITTTNNGIDIATKPTSKVKAIFDGVVSSKLYSPTFQWAVIVKHGTYFSVYSNLEDVWVRQGDVVSEGHPMGRVATNRITGKTEAHLEIWKGTQKVNPIYWIKRK